MTHENIHIDNVNGKHNKSQLILDIDKRKFKIYVFKTSAPNTPKKNNVRLCSDKKKALEYRAIYVKPQVNDGRQNWSTDHFDYLHLSIFNSNQ